MKCENCKELLLAYLEQELNGEKRAEMEEHLAECQDCQKELAWQREMLETLQCLPDEELPKGYHVELMQKLQAEAASNGMPFPIKKKVRKWKQLSMIAAAALVVVAAGGINGMMQMRQSQNEAISQLAEIADETAEDAMQKITEQPAEMRQESFQSAENRQKTVSSAADTEEEMVSSAANAKGKNISVEQRVGNDAKVSRKMDTAAGNAKEDAAVPNLAAIAADEISDYPMMRAGTPMPATDTATLQVDDPDGTMVVIREEIAAAEGFEETASVENSIYAVIPVENFEAFGKAIEALGDLQWTKKGTITEEDRYRSVEIQLYRN